MASRVRSRSPNGARTRNIAAAARRVRRAVPSAIRLVPLRRSERRRPARQAARVRCRWRQAWAGRPCRLSASPPRGASVSPAGGSRPTAVGPRWVRPSAASAETSLVGGPPIRVSEVQSVTSYPGAHRPGSAMTASSGYVLNRRADATP